MQRSKWKGPNFMSSFSNYKKQNFKHCVFRSEMVLPRFTNKIFLIYSGKKFSSLKVTNQIIGCRFGEFIFTRKKCRYIKF